MALSPSNIDLKRLRAFYLVAQQGSLQRAAYRLGVTVPAISIQIRTLESELGVALFNRSGRTLAVTPLGKKFLVEVKTVFDSIDRALAVISRKVLSRDRLTIAMGTDLIRFFSDAIARFIKANPELNISFRAQHSPETLERIREGELDLGIGFFGRIPKELKKHVLIYTGYLKL